MSEVKQITSSIHNYTIHFEDDLSFLDPLLNGQETLFIIDRNVYDLYKKHFAALDGKGNVILLDETEDNKTLAASERIFDAMITLKPTKKTKIVSIGGGITQDV